LGPRLKAVHVLTILQGQASYVLPRAPKWLMFKKRWQMQSACKTEA
jgi:hypothetical protein